MMAAHKASELVYRLVIPTGKSENVTEKLNKLAEEFECKPIEGMSSLIYLA